MLEPFAPATRTWFSEAFPEPTKVQRLGWPHLAKGGHALLLAPTGSGKTLAAFLAGLDRLSQRDPEAKPGVRLLYISPMKALAYDVERNLKAPLVGMARCAERLQAPFTPISMAVRTGDTPQRERRQMLKHPPDVLVTTPESLFLLLGSQARGFLETVETVIVDEIHAIAGTKRGVHMALSLERLAHLTAAAGGPPEGPQRIGLSATQRPLERIADFLGGGREVEIVDTSEPPHIALSIQVSVADMDQPVAIGPHVAESAGQRVSTSSTTGQGTTSPMGGSGENLKPSIWPTIYPKILDLIHAHRTTIVFTNSRLLCERLAQRLNELAGEELVRAHHGSVARHQREQIEELLKGGKLPAIVATSTLELGIDMGAVDLVIQIEAPNSVASGLQRIGRAGHGVGELSEGVLFPKFNGDLLQSVVVAQAMAEGAIEETTIPRNCLDVLAQHLVSVCATETWRPDALFAMVRQASPYAELPRTSFEATLDMLAGRYPSDDFADLRPRLAWDRAKDELTARKGAGMLALMNAGTIPDRGLYGVFLGVEGPRIGELDEEMVHESRKGDVIILGASSWRIEDLTRDKVIVSPAPGEPGRLPFWHGDRPGRPLELGRRLGAFVREIDAQGANASEWLREHTPVDKLAAKNLVDYVAAQREATGLVPHDTRIVVERFKDELGDWRICILSPFGAKVHAPWALALQSLLASRANFDVQALYTDDGIVLRLADTEELPEDEWLWPEPEELEDLIVEQLAHSSVFAARFRENAGRALLLPKRRPDKRSPLWAQRLKAQQLQAVAERFPSFPIILETYRECLSDVFDLDALKSLLADVRSRKIRVETVETRTASPFARSLVFAYVAAYMYEGDAPLAERRAQALTLDRGLLRELLGQEALRELLDADAVAEVEAELQRLAEDRRCKDADHVHDLLRRLGDLTVLEIAARAETDDVVPWLHDLRAQRRAIEVHIAGEARWIAAEDAGRYLHGLGVAIAPGLPADFLDEPERPLPSLFLRFARTHGPFHTAELATRYGLVAGAVDPILQTLEADGQLIRGELRPGGTRAEWCHVEVLRRLKRRSLAKLRQEIEAVDSAVLARFLVDWHGITSTSKRTGPGRLRDALLKLEGLPISWHQLETEVLPARVPGYRPQMLDELAHTGEWVWVGAGPLGSKDGRVVLLQRERAPLLLPDPVDEEPGEPLHTAILDHLAQRGASFLTVLQGAVGATSQDLMPALWDLVWAGLVTNDGFLPLRSLRARTRRRSGPTRFAGGRWSLVSELRYREVAPTEIAHARALVWLERYGVISRQVPRLEGVSGGFSTVYPLLRAMEEQGKARRGHFVEGLEGAQFALPGTVDRLRGHREEDGVDVVLSAADPANPYGALLPWGPCSGTPKRQVGAKVVLVDGRPAMWVGKGAKRFLTLEAFGDPILAKRAVAAWIAQFDRHKTLYVHKIDGDGAKESPHARWFREAGFAEDYRGLIRVT